MKGPSPILTPSSRPRALGMSILTQVSKASHSSVPSPLHRLAHRSSFCPGRPLPALPPLPTLPLNTCHLESHR